MSNEITTPYDRVLIDPNEPLILPDGTAITGRLETFLYALCCLDYDNLPTPLSRIEEFANALITGEIPNIEPQSRSEQFFLALLDGNIDNLPEPQSRSEVLLNKLAVGDFDLTNVDPIQSRYELLLAYLIKNGGVGNLDYVLYGFYQATQTLYNTQEKPVKGAILKGQTLVNLSGKVNTPWTGMTGFSVIQQDNYTMITVNEPDGWFQPAIRNSGLIKTSTQYLMVINVLENTLNTNVYPVGNIAFGKFSSNNNCYIPSKKTGVFKFVLTSKDSFTTTDEQNFDVFMQFGRNEAIGNNIKLNVMIIEYQDGMENWDIPYFEGMKSVKVPVLTTVGKNLFDLDEYPFKNGRAYVSGKPQNWGDYKGIENYFPVKPNTTYTFSNSLGKRMAYGLVYYDANYNVLDYYNQDISTFTTPNSCKYIRFSIQSETLPTWVQIEQDSVATEYEPYKSNILTTSEEVELRGIGDVKDELNLITGEMTQRIGEVVLDGSEEWIKDMKEDNDTFLNIVFKTKNDNITDYNDLNIGMLSDKFKQVTGGSLWSEDISGIGGAYCFIKIGVPKSYLTSADSDGFKQWLSQNPVTVQYQFATESVKTVDLSVIDQDGNVLPKIKTFNDITHVNVSSDGILPKVEMEVATYNEEDIANANVMTTSMDEIYSVQNELDNTNSIQSEEIDSTMIASTEIYENIL